MRRVVSGALIIFGTVAALRPAALAVGNGADWVRYGTEQGLSGDTLAAAGIDRRGVLWTVGKRVVAYFNPEADRWVSIPIQDDLASVRDYTRLAFDSSGNVWVSSFPKVVDYMIGTHPVYKTIFQLHKWDGRIWATYDLRDLLLGTPDHSGIGADIYEMTIAPDGSLWYVGGSVFDKDFYKYGLYHFSDGKLTAVDLAGIRVKNPPSPSGILVDPSGRVWIGYSNSWSAYDIYDAVSGTWIEDSSDQRVKSARLPVTPSLSLDPAGNILMLGSWPKSDGSISRGVALDPATRSIVYELPSTLHSSQFSSVAFDPSGGFWYSDGSAFYHVTLNKGVEGAETQSVGSTYPNPAVAGQRVSVELTHAARSMELRDALGRQLSQEHLWLEGTSLNVNTSKLAAGYYFVTTESNEGREVFRFVVVR